MAGIRVIRDRPALAAAIFYAVLSLLLFSPGLVPGRSLSASDMLWQSAPWRASAPGAVEPFGSNAELADSVVFFQPYLQVTRARLPEVPLWNPHIMGGRPYVANAQSAVFSPWSLPAYVVPFWSSLAIIAVLKLFVAAFGTYLLGQALGMRFAGALLAGSVFAFSLWMVAWVSWTLASVWVYLPWLCLLTELLVRRPGPLPFAGLSAIVGLQYLGGHPESSFHVLLFAFLFWVARVVAARPGSVRAVASKALAFGGALVLGAALAALAIIPFLELLGHSVDLESRGPKHDPPGYLFGLFVHDYWGRQTRVNLNFPFSALQERAYYVGALTLMLAVAAIVLRPRWERIALLVLALCGLAVATGLEPLFGIVTVLPGFDTANNARLAALSVFCFALLAGWGLDELARPRPAPGHRRPVIAAVCLVLLAFPLAYVVASGTLSLERLGSAVRVAWGFDDPPSGSLSGPDMAGLVRLAALLEWLVLAAAALGLIVLRLRGRLSGTAFAALAVALIVADLFKAGVGWNPAVPVEHARQPATGAIRYLQAQRPARFVALEAAPWSVAPPIVPNVAMRYGLYDARGYDFPVVGRYLEFWRRNVAPTPDCSFAQCTGVVAKTPRALRALGLLGVTHIVQDPLVEPWQAPGMRLAYEGTDARVYTNPHALPRAFVVGCQRVVPEESTAEVSLSASGMTARSVAVTDRRLPGLCEAPRSGAPPAGTARIGVYEAERVVARTSTARAALLVLTDNWFPGWTATVDGRSTPVHRVDHLLRGVRVPAGEHEVEFRYEPAGWRAGWIISGLAVLVLLATAFIGWRRLRRV